MLKNTKSIYFIKRLFTFVDEKKKLNIIKYNKNMQNILDISLINPLSSPDIVQVKW